jgi:uncharacterized protein (TIGR02145 family)
MKSTTLPNEGDKKIKTGNFLDPRDENQYKWVKIGSQVWMAENLRYNAHESSPKSINGIWVYGNKCKNFQQTENYQTYGCLYDWDTALKCCPPGWHLPSDAEWTQLETYLIANGYNNDEKSTGNKIVKSLASTTTWLSCLNPGTIGNNLSANNKSGFTALPGGTRGYRGTFVSVGLGGYWWSGTEFNSSRAWNRTLTYNKANFRHHHCSKAYGLSVRCVRD